MRLPVYLGLLEHAEGALADAFVQVADGHGDEPDVHSLCHLLAGQCRNHQEALRPVLDRYGDAGADDEPERLHAAGMSDVRTGGLGLLRDLQDLHVLAGFVEVTWTLVAQAAQGLRDAELLAVVHECEGETALQARWLLGRMKQAAPQALIVG